MVDFWNRGLKMKKAQEQVALLQKIVDKGSEYGFTYRSPWICKMTELAPKILEGKCTFNDYDLIVQEEVLDRALLQQYISLHTPELLVKKTIEKKRIYPKE